jgi:hypothetical protein
MGCETLVPEFNIEIVETPQVSEEYRVLREEIWQQTVEEGKQVGKEFYNGEIYRLINFDEESRIIQFGTMQYADRLLKTKISQEEIVQRFGKDHVMQHCVVNAILVTSDKKLVVGVKKNSVDLKQGKLGYIGGNLNADEVKVNSFEDIYTMMLREIEEETNIDSQRERISFRKLVANGNFASFYFIYQLGISSEEIDTIYREGEFIKLETMTPNEIVSTDRVGITDFNQSKEWIESLISD